VSQKPQRPYVPHRTPTTAQPAITASEFRLATPFVPGRVREMVESIAVPESTGEPEPQSQSSALLRPIEDFLDTSPAPGRGYAQATNDVADVDEFEEEHEELPPVEHFMDPLPAVDEFAPAAERALIQNGATNGEENAASSGPRDPAESGWLETDWQHYDWRAAAALGESGNDEATNAWATTDWGGIVSRAREGRQTAAHAIAKALDEIAQRIRDGELAVPGSGAMPDPTTIAATLAALLGVKR
jgi:hypothetical protein